MKKSLSLLLLAFLALSLLVSHTFATPKCSIDVQTQKIAQDCNAFVGDKISCSYLCAQVCSCSASRATQRAVFTVLLPKWYQTCDRFTISQLFSQRSTDEQIKLMQYAKKVCSDAGCKCATTSAGNKNNIQGGAPMA